VTPAADWNKLSLLMASGSQVPAVLRLARLLGIVQAAVMVIDTIPAMLGRMVFLGLQTHSAGALSLTIGFGDFAGLVVTLLLCGGIILVASLRLTHPGLTARYTLMTLEIFAGLGLFFAVGIAALITVPLALAIIVCLMLSGARQPIKEPGQTRVA
jgi:hypothetical protein